MKKILVPSDFTSVSEIAIKYASEIGQVLQTDVYLLHIVKKESETAEAETKLAKQAAEHLARTGLSVKCLVKVGNIFDDIPQVAKDEQAQLVVMGTHGLHGMQFIVGSNALRVVTECPVPIIIVQEGISRPANINKLLLPLDLHKETKQKLNIAADVARRFKSEVHIISPKESDEFLHNRIQRNVSYSEGYLEEHNIPYKTTITQSGSGGFVKELLTYATYAEIDLICILNNAEEQLIHAFGVDSEQKIITNDSKIPVMIMNPMATLVDSNSIFAQ